MNRSLFLSNRARWAVALATLGAALGGFANPYVPTSGQQVLERLRPAPLDRPGRELRLLRTRLAGAPANETLALEVARRCIAQSRAESDPRFLGQAQAVLQPWWDLAEPSPSVLVLRGTIKQSLHDFRGCLSDLDTALRLAPNEPQAWLTRATVLTVLGRYQEARVACLALGRLAPEWVATTAAAQVASLTGQADRASSALREAMNRSPQAAPAERLWALTLLGEMAARLARPTEAEHWFRQALTIDPQDSYALGALADLLLDERRPREVIPLLAEQTRVDSLLLRLAVAESEVQPASTEFKSHLNALRSRFEANKLRGQSIHQREEARFALGLEHNSSEALRLAMANWNVQREPADLRVYLEAALAARQPAAARPALDFLRLHGLEDAHLQQLASQLEAHASSPRSVNPPISMPQ